MQCEALPPGREMQSRLGDNYIPPWVPPTRPAPPRPSTARTDGTDVSDVNDLIHELWGAELEKLPAMAQVGQCKSIPIESRAASAMCPRGKLTYDTRLSSFACSFNMHHYTPGTGVVAARERRKRAAMEAHDFEHSGMPYPYVASAESVAHSRPPPPPSPWSLERSREARSVGSMGGMLGKKPNAAAESQGLVTARRLADLTKRREVAAAAAAQAKVGTFGAAYEPFATASIKYKNNLVYFVN